MPEALDILPPGGSCLFNARFSSFQNSVCLCENNDKAVHFLWFDMQSAGLPTFLYKFSRFSEITPDIAGVWHGTFGTGFWDDTCFWVDPGFVLFLSVYKVENDEYTKHAYMIKLCMCFCLVAK